MKTLKLGPGLTAVFLAAVMLLSAFLLSACKKEEEIYDPYEGMVSVSNGAGGQMWIVPLEDVGISEFSREDFFTDGAYIRYRGQDYYASRGIDVSEHQQEIDWQAVSGDGVEFAVIRAGYRGYSQGGLAEDAFFKRNVEGALNAGLKVGVYFFSQAVSVEEAREEAQFLLELIGGYSIELPVFFDWEPVANVGETRTDEIDIKKISDFCRAFSDVVEAAGYEAGVYFYRSQGYHDYKLDKLTDLTFWSAAPGDYPDFYYAHSFWQYSYTGTVSGIEGGVDLNLRFEKLPGGGSAADPMTGE